MTSDGKAGWLEGPYTPACLPLTPVWSNPVFGLQLQLAASLTLPEPV